MKDACIKLTVVSLVVCGSAYLALHSASGQQVTPSGQQVAPGPFAQSFPSQLQPLFSFDGAPADPEVAKFRADEATAERDVARLVAEYGRAQGEAARGKIKSSLTAALEKEFDLQQKRRDLEVAAVEARIKKVRELIQKRAEARQSIVEKRADQLMREADGLGWTVPSGINPNQSSSGNIGLRR